MKKKEQKEIDKTSKKLTDEELNQVNGGVSGEKVDVAKNGFVFQDITWLKPK